MSPNIERAIAERARTQLGLITRSQLGSLGLTKHNVLTLVDGGWLERIGHHVLRIAGAPATYDQRVLAACLDTGGVASHRTAAALHHLDGFPPPDDIEVTVTRRLRHHVHPLAIVHTSTNLPVDDLVHVGPIPATGVARTFLGLAALAPAVSERSIGNALDVAARDGLVSDEWLWWRLERLRCRGRNGVTAMEAILRGRRHLGPTESWLEHRFMELLDEAAIPLPKVQRRVRASGNFVARVDASYEPFPLVIELDGHASHSTREQRLRDERRRNRLTLAGRTVIVFTYDHVVGDPVEVVSMVREALAPRVAA